MWRPAEDESRSIFATKSIEQLKAEAGHTGQHSLKRVLGPVNLVTLGVGAIIGTGIFVLTGEAAAANAGPAIVLSMVVAGIASALAGLCYSEFASTVPVAGSAYTYAYATLGEFVAWIIGWDLILEYALGAATVAVGWSGHLDHACCTTSWASVPGRAQPRPARSCSRRRRRSPRSSTCPRCSSTSPSRSCSSSASRSRRPSTRSSSSIKVAVVLIVIGGRRMFVDPANWHPFIPPNTGTFGEYGWSGILRGAGVIFFAYIGFDAVSTSAQEARNPQRDMPIGILGSLVVCTVLYVLVSGVMVGLVPYKQMQDRRPRWSSRSAPPAGRWARRGRRCWTR